LKGKMNINSGQDVSYGVLIGRGLFLERGEDREHLSGKVGQVEARVILFVEGRSGGGRVSSELDQGENVCVVLAETGSGKNPYLKTFTI